MFRLDSFRIECRYDFETSSARSGRAGGADDHTRVDRRDLELHRDCFRFRAIETDRFGREFRKSIGLHFDQIQTGAQSFVLKDARFVCLRGELNARNEIQNHVRA